MAGDPLVSVVVSARGNGHRLPGLLAALAEQIPAGGLEAVVVDNDPPGRRVVADAVGRGMWPFPVRTLREVRPGASRGRNAGIGAARGRYVALTDPDIRPRPGWLQALLSAAADRGAALVGGKVVTHYPEGMAIALGWPTARPLAECHGPLDWPDEQVAYGWPYWIVTANMLVDRLVVPRLGLLRTDLGRRGRLPLDCEDLEFADRAVQAGLRVLIEPRAVVDHPVGFSQTRPGWFLAQGIGHGVCVARMRTTVGVPAGALRAGTAEVKDAAGGLIGGWGFLDGALATVALRDLARIAAYHLERARLVLAGRTLLPTTPPGATPPGHAQEEKPREHHDRDGTARS